MANTRITKRQLELLADIELIKMQGYEPSISFLARKYKVHYMSMYDCLRGMETKGLISLEPRIAGCSKGGGGLAIRVREPMFRQEEDTVIIGENLTLKDIGNSKIAK